MKNVVKIYDSTVTKVEKVYLCYGHKTYKKFSEKRYKSENACIEKAAIAVLWDRHNGAYEVCIGIKKWLYGLTQSFAGSMCRPRIAW